MAKTAQQMAGNWDQAMRSPTTVQKYKDGINGTTVNPMQLAATPQAEQLYITNVQASVTSGRRAAALNAADPQQWKNNAVNVGANSLASGATKAKNKVMAHFNKWAPVYQQAASAAAALPKGGMANAMARVQAAMQVMMQAAGKA